MHRSLMTFVAITALVSSVAHAAFSIEELNQATALAVSNFKSTKPEHVAHFSGYKSWKSGDEAKVKIYVAHDGMNMEFNYVCHKHGANIECHAQ